MSDEKICRMIELARGHIEAGGEAAAGVYYRMIIKDTSPPVGTVQRKAHGEACIYNARKDLAERKIGSATDWYRRAVEADPLATDYRVEYVRRALLPMGMLKNARIVAEQATRMDPTNKAAWSILGQAEHALGNIEAAIAAYDRQMAIDPNDPYPKFDRCMIAMDTADYRTVETLVRPLLDGKQAGDAADYLGMASYRQGRHKLAIDLYGNAIEWGCQDPEMTRWNMSLAQHSIGDYDNGWKNHEARGRQNCDPAMRLIYNRFQRPHWNGEKGSVHLHQEMGMGDLIAMLRYVPMVQDRCGGQVSLEVADTMVDLCRRSLPGVEVMPKALDYPGALGIKPFDFHLPMLSLPFVFGTETNTVPTSPRYLTPDHPALVQKFDGAIGGLTTVGFDIERPRVGLCWSSGIRTGEHGIWLAEYGRRKSMTFEHMRPIFDQVKHFDFVSLQVGPERDQLHRPVKDVLPRYPSWDDTAAVIANLDMVITVDTSVAHLAGALGKPVWVMMHTEGSWHWMTERIDSPWYPTARLFRQERPHEWVGVIREVRAALDASCAYGEPIRAQA